MSVKGLLPSQCGKSEVAAFGAWPQTHSIAATLQLHKILPLHISCVLLLSFCGFSKSVDGAVSKFPPPTREERKALIPLLLSSLSPTMLEEEKPLRAACSEPCSHIPVYAHAAAGECNCAHKSMCDNIIQMPHHALGLCQSHPMKHTEQMLIVKS